MGRYFESLKNGPLNRSFRNTWYFRRNLEPRFDSEKKPYFLVPPPHPPPETGRETPQLAEGKAPRAPAACPLGPLAGLTMAETVEELGADGSSPAHVEPPGPSPTQLNSTWLVVWWCFGSVWMLLDTYNVLPAGLGWLFFQVVWWLMVQVLVYVAWPWMLAPGLLIDGPVRILLALLPNLTGYMLPLVPRFVQELILVRSSLLLAPSDRDFFSPLSARLFKWPAN